MSDKDVEKLAELRTLLLMSPPPPRQLEKAREIIRGLEAALESSAVAA
mgnify:CR=1 FL=1